MVELSVNAGRLSRVPDRGAAAVACHPVALFHTLVCTIGIMLGYRMLQRWATQQNFGVYSRCVYTVVLVVHVTENIQAEESGQN